MEEKSVPDKTKPTNKYRRNSGIYSPKKAYSSNSVQHHLSLLKSKFKKIQCDNSHLLGWLNLKRQPIMSVGEDVEKLELSYIVGRKAKLCSRFRECFGNFSIY